MRATFPHADHWVLTTKRKTHLAGKSADGADHPAETAETTTQDDTTDLSISLAASSGRTSLGTATLEESAIEIETVA